MKPKIDAVTIIKVLGMALTIGGTIASGWAGKKENDKTLEKLVNDRLADK